MSSDSSRSEQSLPEWFTLSERATQEVMSRVAATVRSREGDLQVKSAPMLAHWFFLDSLTLANQANKAGMHANALALTRQCVEALGVIELGLCKHPDADDFLLTWEADKQTPGKLRAWLEQNVWPTYGTGLWTESWSVFMREFAGAVQPYAHYGRSLAQWQTRLVQVQDQNNGGPITAIVEMRPHAYDAQKATRITLFHALLCFALGKAWSASNPSDSDFAKSMRELGDALGRSRYLDGHKTNWSQQFWAMVWLRDGGILLE